MVTSVKSKSSEGPLVLATIGVVVFVCIGMCIPAKYIRSQQEQATDSGVVRIISDTTYRGSRLIIFQDTLSNARVMHYRDAMVVLPELSDPDKAVKLDALVREYEELNKLQ